VELRKNTDSRCEKMKNMEELIEHHRNFAEKVIKANRGFRPQIVISVKNEIIPFLIAGDVSRYTIKTVLNKIDKLKSNADWIIIMHEAYSKACKSNKIAEQFAGNLEEKYLAGDTGVKWVFSMQAYFKDNDTKKFIKRMVVYEITKGTLDFNKIWDDDNFEGYLTLDV